MQLLFNKGLESNNIVPFNNEFYEKKNNDFKNI